MASRAPKYYRPYYPSDSEESDASEEDSAAEEEAIANVANLPDYVSFAKGLYRASGPPFSTEEVDLQYAQNILDRRTEYGPMVEGQEGYTVETSMVQNDNVVVLQSLDRDKSIYPQPINCQLMLPRTYVNVTRFEIANITFLASFFYFRNDKYNTSFLFQEAGRLLYSQDLKPSIVASNLNLPLTIREGTYAIDALLEEITIQFNTPPLFYDFINGYPDFYINFIREGDYFLNFNYPGDYYYDSLRDTYIANPTRDQIVSYYFQQPYALPTPLSKNNTFTDSQTKVAYYYPVIKEILLDSTYSGTLTYNGTILRSTTESAYRTQLIYDFKGIDDPIVIAMVQDVTNINTLDAYRLAHTFRYHSINNYVCSYGTQNTIVNIQATTLNTSLVTLLNVTYSNLLVRQIQQGGISLAEYNASATLLTVYTSILSEMYNVLQSNFAYKFGVNYGTLGNLYFLSFSNVVLLKNGLYASNVFYTYTTQNSPFLSENIEAAFRQSNTAYWRNMTYPPSSQLSNTLLDSNAGIVIYNTRILTPQEDHPFQLPTGTYMNPVERSVDITVTVKPGAYTIIPIQSKFRQTAQVELLPRPSIYLYPVWNDVNRDTIGFNSAVFSNQYYTNATIGSNIRYSLNPPLSNLGLASNTLVAPYLTQPVTTLSLASTPNGMYFSFTFPPASLSNAVGKYQAAISFFPGSNSLPYQGPPVGDRSINTFVDSMSVFVYHDEGAFYADVGPVGQSNGENPFLYKYALTIPKGSGVQSIYFSGYEGETYYVCCRAKNKTAFTPIPFVIVPFTYTVAPLLCNVDFDPRLPSFNPYVLMHSNYYIAQVHDPDYIRLPIIDSNGYYYKTSILSCNIGFLPSATTNPAMAPINIPLLKPIVRLGYSTANVSDDLTDYIPIINTNPPRAFDPVTTYMFQYITGSSYNPESRTYDIGKGNTLLNPNGSLYLGSNDVPVRQTKIVQYTGSHYIPTVSNAFTATTTLQKLTSSTVQGLQTPFDMYGPCGILFIPEEGTWSLTRFTLMCQTAETNTHFLAIFPASYLNFVNLKNISLSKAISLCVLVKSTTYSNAPTGVAAGTYYTYSNVFNPLSNYIVAGLTQSTPTLITDTNAYYSAISYSFSNPATLCNTRFTLADFIPSFITPFDNLTGTPIPYPDLGFRVSNKFYDSTPIPDTNYNMILCANRSLAFVPSTQPIQPLVNGNIKVNNFYTSQYAESSPIVNAHLHYTKTNYQLTDFYTYSNYFLLWYSVPDIPINICTTVDGTLMFQTAAFPIASYVTFQESTTFSLETTLTHDMLFAPNETILAQSGTSNSYLFLGANSDSLIFKEYRNGLISEYPRISGLGSSIKAQTLLVKGTQWWLCYIDTAQDVSICYGSNFSSIAASNTFVGTYTSASIAFDPVLGGNIYFALNIRSGCSNIYSFPLTDRVPQVSLARLQSYAVHSNTISISVQTIYGVDYIYSAVASNTYLYRMNTQTRAIVESAQNLLHQPITCQSGTQNALWILFESAPYIMAFVFTLPSIHIAWQQFFPVMKIEFNRIADQRISIPDTFNLTTPEWYHSALFSYSNLNTLTSDIASNGSMVWGKETAFQTSDTSFSGYYFNAYLQDVPLQSNTSYVALRGFSPTESFQAHLRIALPNVYDFGYVSFTDMINEIATLSNTGQYSVAYSQQLSTFNTGFIRSNADAFYGISSFYVPTTGFSNFMVEYSTIFGTYTTLKSNANAITVGLRNEMNTFISTNLQYILPPTALTRDKYTESLPFSFLWKTALETTPPDYANLTDAWGLGWNLGFPKKDDELPMTIHSATSLYKVTDDFLYLRMNPEFNLNRMSAGTKENYMDSREPSGLTSYYYCKLLLNGYGQKATTFVHSPVILNPPISKMSKLSFQWIDARGNLMNIPSATDSDWEVTVNIQENVQVSKFVQTTPLTPADFLRPTSDSVPVTRSNAYGQKPFDAE